MLLPENNGGFKALDTKENPYRKTDERVYTQITSDHSVDLVRYQVANCYMGSVSLINSGGASTGRDDLAQAVYLSRIRERSSSYLTVAITAIQAQTKGPEK